MLVDEAQFLTKAQVWQISDVVDRLGIPVLAYGLRTDFRGELFEGSRYLLAWADNLEEIKTICHTGRKATMVVRVDEHGRAVTDGPQVEIGGNERYVSVSRAEFKRISAGRAASSCSRRCCRWAKRAERRHQSRKSMSHPITIPAWQRPHWQASDEKILLQFYVFGKFEAVRVPAQRLRQPRPACRGRRPPITITPTCASGKVIR